MFRWRVFLLLVLQALPSAAAERSAGPLPAYLHTLSCRIMAREAGQSIVLTPLAEANLDSLSAHADAYTFGATLRNGRELTAVVRHVFVKLPRERFNVALFLDGKPHLRLNHVDLDIYVETTIDNQHYILHCFPWIEPSRQGTNGGVSFPAR
jgi:hypothetical protein